MRAVSLLLMGLVAVAAADAQHLTRVSKKDLKSRAVLHNGPSTKLSMWIWADKYTYQAGQTLTLRWTVKSNGDLYPYTVFVYRQNNQTGKKTYFPGGDTPSDMFGNTLGDGFEPVQMADANKQVLIGSGGTFSGLTIPSEPGMHTLVVQLRDYTGTRVLKTAYFKIGVITGTQTLSGDITSDTTLHNDTQWNLTGVVFVKNGATLTIEPGTFIMGQPGSEPPSALVIAPTGKLMAAGTRARPIVMTSSQPFGQRLRGDWGGLLFMGTAPVNVLANSHGQTNPAGQFYLEGLTASPDTLYGGTDDTHNCGTVQYVRVEYAGSILSPNNETNSFTFAGCGSDTVADHLQAIYGLDDAFEWFGGTMNAKYLVGGLIRDDYTDFQLGFTGKVQYGIMYEDPDYPGNRGIEGDNNEYTSEALPEPFTNPTFYNISYIGSGNFWDDSNNPGLYLRFGVHGSFNNLLVTNFWGPCMQFPDTVTQGQVDQGFLTMNGVLCWGNNQANSGANTLEGQIATGTGDAGAYTLAYAQGQKGNGAGKSIMVEDPLLTRPFEFNDPDFSLMLNSPALRAGWVQPPDDGFFDQSAQFLGGMGAYDWTEEWTCFLRDLDIAP